MKYTCKRHNNKYNIITLERVKAYEYYLEKKGYGNLFFMFGISSEMLMLDSEYINKYIEIAEKQNFWGDE